MAFFCPFSFVKQTQFYCNAGSSRSGMLSDHRAKEAATTPSASSDTALAGATGATTGAASGLPRLSVRLKFSTKSVTGTTGESPTPHVDGLQSSHHITREAARGQSPCAAARDGCAVEAAPRGTSLGDGAGESRGLHKEERRESPGEDPAPGEEGVSRGPGGADGRDDVAKMEEDSRRDGVDSSRRNSGSEGKKLAEGVNGVPSSGGGTSSSPAAPSQSELEMRSGVIAVDLPNLPSPTGLAAASGSEEAAGHAGECRAGSPALPAAELRASLTAGATLDVSPPETNVMHNPDGAAMDTDSPETGVPSDPELTAMDVDPLQSDDPYHCEDGVLVVGPPGSGGPSDLPKGSPLCLQGLPLGGCLDGASEEAEALQQDPLSDRCSLGCQSSFPPVHPGLPGSNLTVSQAVIGSPGVMPHLEADRVLAPERPALVGS